MAEVISFLDYREPEWVAEKLGLDKNTVYKYLQEGVLPGVQLGRKWLVSERLLAEHLERETRKQTQFRAGTGGDVIGSGPGLNAKLRRARLEKTPRLRRAMDIARTLAERDGADAVGSEHALRALAEVTDGVAAIVLRNLGASEERLRQLYAEHAPLRAPLDREGRITASPELRLACGLAVDEAVGMGHTYLGGEHLLLGILREPNGLGARMLDKLGITYEAARAELMKHIHGVD
jgi:excisionase family DNA binding protein